MVDEEDMKELLDAMTQVDEDAIWVVKPESPRCPKHLWEIHTGNVWEVDVNIKDLKPDDILDWGIMTPEDVDQTLLANGCYDSSDIGYDRYLVVLLRWDWDVE